MDAARILMHLIASQVPNIKVDSIPKSII